MEISKWRRRCVAAEDLTRASIPSQLFHHGNKQNDFRKPTTKNWNQIKNYSDERPLKIASYYLVALFIFGEKHGDVVDYFPNRFTSVALDLFGLLSGVFPLPPFSLFSSLSSPSSYSSVSAPIPTSMSLRVITQPTRSIRFYFQSALIGSSSWPRPFKRSLWSESILSSLIIDT